MIKEMKKGCISFLVWAGCHDIICSFWRALEITTYGAVQPRDVDTIISVLFSLALWRLVRNWWTWGGRDDG